MIGAVRPLLRSLWPRIAAIAFAGWLFFRLEPAFNPHPESPADPAYADPLTLAAAASHLASLAVVLLLAGFVSGERRSGAYRMVLAHPVHPLRWYGLRWLLAIGVAVGAALLFLVLGQLAGWGEFRGGLGGLVLPLIVAIVWGGLLAFLSATLPRGDGWVALALFLPTVVPEILLLLQGLPGWMRSVVYLLLPPQTTAFADIYSGLIARDVQATPVVFALGYGLFWLALGAAIVRWREWD